ncbi:hypothetical protein [Arsukibacterium sp. MJ3]|uniref:hypothetical protein n=1 Tax=Arsukibacterium sp. MJ3 TaxID=1632859 RepID=UPI001F255B6F|nr:hypothetical protein [Arsukibacterium sp. MJ3]
MHLAPRADAHSMGDSQRSDTFGYLVQQLDKRKIAFICSREAQGADSLGPKLKQLFGGVYITNEKFDKASANALIASGDADAVAFGVPYIANPDLVTRFARDAALNSPKPELFYGGGAKGYTDYPALAG